MQNSNLAPRPFEADSSGQGKENGSTENTRKLVVMQAAPRFAELVQESRYRCICESMAALWETPPEVCTLDIRHRSVWPSDHLPVPGIFTSLLVHFSVVFFICTFPFSSLFGWVSHGRAADEDRPKVVYHLQMINLANFLPTMHPLEEAGIPGRGVEPRKPPKRGSSARDPRVRVISNPAKPDNDHQTIIQPATPPELKIKKDIPVPNLVLQAMAPAPPAPPVAPSPRIPTEALVRKQTPAPAPAPAPQTIASIPLAPQVTSRPNLGVVPSNVIGPQPLMAAPPEAPAQAAGTEGTKFAESSNAPGTGSDGRSLVTLSLNPALMTGSVALPPGNRLGAFEISAVGPDQGTVGGVPGGNPQAGEGGKGTSGNGSSGLGTGKGTGGGGTGAADTPSTMQSAGAKDVYVGGILPPLAPEKLVYRVKPQVTARAPGLIVSAGPGGGGGLRIYGVLHGGKIYTVYLPMGEKSWVLQYCVRDDGQAKEAQERTVRIQMEAPLTPPATIEQFDFHRPPLPKDKASQMIILQGSIDEQGIVGNLKVIRGVDDVADRAARAAFAGWKFKPASRAGTPVALEILVGIPAMVSKEFEEDTP